MIYLNRLPHYTIFFIKKKCTSSYNVKPTVMLDVLNMVFVNRQRVRNFNRYIFPNSG